MRSPKKPELATSARSPGSIRLAAAMSIASVPDPATTNGWPSGARKTSRVRSSAWPNAAMKSGATWLVVGAPSAANTAGSNSMGPGIISRVRFFMDGVLLMGYGVRAPL